MLRTLHTYLMRELVKATLLSAVAFTLLLTVLTILQPLRKMGLATEQVIRLFGFTLPVMISFTLPVSALFAATIVYGRFSQDNELLACRASGVATLALLKPALMLGAMVTAISLVLNNYIAPKLASMAGLAVQTNLRGLIYHPLKTRSYVEFGRFGQRHIIHADLLDTEHDTLYGTVYARIRKTGGADAGKVADRSDVRPAGEAIPRPVVRLTAKAPAGPPAGAAGGAVTRAVTSKAAAPAADRRDDVAILSAATAYLDFRAAEGGGGQVAVQLIEPALIGTRDPGVLQEASQPILLPIENPLEERASWYGWDRLLRTLREPTLHGEVGRRLTEIKEWICGDLLGQEVLKAIRAGRPYDGLIIGDETYQLKAAKVAVDDDGTAVLTAGTGPRGEDLPATVTILRRGRPVQVITANIAKVFASWSPMTRRPQVTLDLQDGVTVKFFGPGAAPPHRPTSWRRGEIPFPPEVQARAEQVSLADIYARPEELTGNRKVLAAIRSLKTDRIPKLKGALLAELHARIAYGLSCFLMVAMGAALGLIFRGGQFISAFVLSLLPASAVIITMLMGKEMVRNPDVEMTYGLAAIWAGIVILLAANALIYWRLARK